MKLIVCDSFQMSTFELPNKVEDYFMINYSYSASHVNSVETLTLEARNGIWCLLTDDYLKIEENGISFKMAELHDYSKYRLKFETISEYIYIYLIPDCEQYTGYAITDNMNITVGRGENCVVRYNDDTMLDVCLSFQKEGDRFCLKAEEAIYFVYLNGYSVTAGVLSVGDVIFLNGLRMIWLGTFFLINHVVDKKVVVNLMPFYDKDSSNVFTPVSELEKSVKLFREDAIFFHTPKIKSELKVEKVIIEAPPAKSITENMPMFLTMGSSMIFALMSCTTGISAIRGLMQGTTDNFSAFLEIGMCGLMLISAVFFPFMMEQWQKNRERKMEKKRQVKYSKYLDDKLKEINEIIHKQGVILKENNLSLEAIATNILNNQGDIWSRDIFDSDFLTFSLGIGDVEALIEIEAPKKTFSLEEDNLMDRVLEIASERYVLKQVPVTISCLENRVLPIVIDMKYRFDYINSIMLEFLYYHSGKDLKIVIFTSESNSRKWDYFRYLPHCWEDNYERRFFASNEEEMVTISMFLESEYDKRKNMSGDDDKVSKNDDSLKYLDFSKYYLIVTDDFKTARDISIVNKIIDSDVNLGFSLLIFESSIKNLPSKVNRFVNIDENSGNILEKNVCENGFISFKPLYLKNPAMFHYSRLIFNVPLYNKSVNTGIPNNLAFLDMFLAGRVDQLNILSRWQNNDPTVSLKAPVGEKERGKYLELDLHEKSHGPHGLIAGSTGSGKSEFIISYILSMAVNYHPYEVQFILIDYKGGGLALAFENRETGVKIPHLVGTITNLDTSEMNRTLVSLKSELHRRQRIFNKTRESLNESTVDIYKYQRFYREGKVSEPMSHLFVISDEFAELKDQQPDFMDELISTARIGRSLGVHLILATQKPSGVVNDQIWSNTRFRVCLKVQTTEDSIEMLKRPDAASIKEVGRFYLQVGNDELFEYGQSAWAGARYYPADKISKKIDDNIDFIDNFGEVIKVVNDEVKKEDITDYGEQLTNIVKYLYDIAKRENIEFNSLWLPSLPNEIFLGNLMKKYHYQADINLIDAVIGEYDKPKSQLQGLYKISLIDKNTIIFGLPGYGKENYIMTLLFSLCVSYRPVDIQFYILDFGAEVLKVFMKMPHVGDVMLSNDIDKILILFQRLEKEIGKRKNLFSEYAGTFSDYCKNSGKRVPLIVVVLNSYESFRENCNNDMDDYLAHLSREGSKYGIVFVISSVATNSVRSSMLDCYSNKVLLSLQDSFDYQYILGADHGLVPKKVFGRGLTIIDEEACEIQTCFIHRREEINDYVKQVGTYLMSQYKFKVPAIRIMPNQVTYSDLHKFLGSINQIPVGFDVENVNIVYYNFCLDSLNLITGNSCISNISFFGGIIDLIDAVSNIKFTIIDFLDCIEFEGNANFYSGDYSVALDCVINDCKMTDGIKICFLVGVGNIRNALTDEEYYKFETIMKNRDAFTNTYFILVDDCVRLNNLGDCEWFINHKFTSGIWYGTGILKQSIFNVEALLDYDEGKDFENMAFVIRDNLFTEIKTMGDGIVDNFDESSTNSGEVINSFGNLSDFVTKMENGTVEPVEIDDGFSIFGGMFNG